MAITIDLPHVGESVIEGIIGKWLKQPGDKLERYDPLVEVVTDKVTMEVPSPVNGVLSRILAKEGETVPMGAPIAEIETEEAQPPSATHPGAPTQAVSRREVPGSGGHYRIFIEGRKACRGQPAEESRSLKYRRRPSQSRDHMRSTPVILRRAPPGPRAQR